METSYKEKWEKIVTAKEFKVNVLLKITPWTLNYTRKSLEIQEIDLKEKGKAMQ